MKQEIAYAMWFQTVEGIGDRTLYKMYKYFGSMKEAFRASESMLKTVLSGKQFYSFLEAKRKITPKEWMEILLQKGIRYIPFFDEIYPSKLLHIPEAPFGIFVRGSLPDETRASVAMIGARACSDYGKEVATCFANELAKYEVQVISGMARGIDAISQASCIKAGGDTYAVLGCGVDVCYPPEMSSLYDAMLERGGVISTYPPGASPKAGCFPARNRIISAFADVVLVVEAGEKSGTLITVDMALEQGKEVAIIPGRITDRLSQGCLKLLSQGAHPVMCVEELLELLKGTFSPQTNKKFFNKYKSQQNGINFTKNISLSEELKSVLKLLSKEPVDAEKLYDLWKKSGALGDFVTFTELLMDLELLDLCISNKNRVWIR